MIVHSSRLTLLSFDWSCIWEIPVDFMTAFFSLSAFYSLFLLMMLSNSLCVSFASVFLPFFFGVHPLRMTMTSSSSLNAGFNVAEEVNE